MDRRTTIRWDRLGRWALIAVFGFVLYLYVGPARSWVSAYKEAGQRRQQVAALKVRNDELRARKRDLQKAASMEREARRLGMAKAGEREYVIEGLPDK
jgi:cell division protein FtsB